MLGWKKITNLVTLGEELLGSQQKEKPTRAQCMCTRREAGGGAGRRGKNWVVLTTVPCVSSPPTCPVPCAGRDNSCRNLIFFFNYRNI